MTNTTRNTTGQARAEETPAARSLRLNGLLILSIGTFTLGVDGFVLSGLLPQVASSLHVSASTAGQLTTLFALVYAVASPVIATVAGSWDRRRLLAVGMAVFIIGMIVQATGPTFAVVAAVPRLAPVAVGLNGSAIYIGSALGAAIGGLTLAVGGSAAPTITAAVIGLLATVIAATAVRDA